jgi:hypothetical protein
VPAATFLGLRLWYLRSRAATGAAAQGDADQSESELARSVTAMQDRLTELSDQLEAMSRDWAERDHRLKSQLNDLLTFTEQMARIDPWIGEKIGEKQPGERSGARKPPRP